jgi:anti-sigma factor RsiW
MACAADLTCSQAERAISRELDGLLTRHERRRLRAHVRGCDECSSCLDFHRRRRLAFRKLRLVPVPISLQVFRFGGV